MGVDYRYAGSASYPRFDREICAIAELAGAIETKYLADRKESEIENSIEYWFGFLSGANQNEEKFIFPEEVSWIVAKWLNHPYDQLTANETKQIWYIISQHPEVRDVSEQIWEELQMLCQCGEGWNIS